MPRGHGAQDAPADGRIQIVVTARDTGGNQVSTKLTITFD